MYKSRMSSFTSTNVKLRKLLRYDPHLTVRPFQVPTSPTVRPEIHLSLVSNESSCSLLSSDVLGYEICVVGIVRDMLGS